jgi:hypothetical protein
VSPDEGRGQCVRPADPCTTVERGWTDAYLPSDQFAAFLEGEQGRIAGLLKDLDLVQ